jgi:uncharacterized protein YndB with AHSA1/START domain
MAAVGDRMTTFTFPSDCEIAMARVFDAPRAMVFDAWTKPELLKRWWGPPGWTLPVCEIDLCVGGAWRQVMRGANGKEMVLHGVYREVVRPQRLVYTQLITGCGGQGSAEALNTMTFVEEAGRTTMTSTMRYPSKEVRDSVINSGGRRIDEVYDRLAELLTSGDAIESTGGAR